MSKQEWKKLLNDTVHSHIEAMWRADIGEKSSLKYVNPNFLKVGKSHHVWSTVRNCLTDNMRAQLKCKLLMGTYILQGNRAAFNQYTIDPTCKLCLAAPETRQHFLLNVQPLKQKEIKFSQRICEIIQFSLMNSNVIC